MVLCSLAQRSVEPTELLWRPGGFTTVRNLKGFRNIGTLPPPSVQLSLQLDSVKLYFCQLCHMNHNQSIKKVTANDFNNRLVVSALKPSIERVRTLNDPSLSSYSLT